MKTNVLEKPVKSISNFSLNAELREVTTNGMVNFYPKKDTVNAHPFWNGKKLIIPVYGVYKISWGFYQSSIKTFYKDVKTELGLAINNKIHDEKAVITKETTSFHALKSSHKTITFLLRENEKLFLNAEVLNSENPNMKDVYFKVEKLDVEENNKFGYEN